MKNTLTKGSAFPRGLSSSGKIYLAPDLSSDNQFDIAVREGTGDVQFFNADKEALLCWPELSSSQQAQIRWQLENIAKRKDALKNWGLPNPAIMGIVNVTPDSFSDGGHFLEMEKAVDQARKLADEGAHILDIGGESTRPGADEVSAENEIDRIHPVFENLKPSAVMLSIDSRKSSVMQAAVNAGATLINDVTALEFDQQSKHVAKETDAFLCLMHSSADPKVMQDNPDYNHALFDVYDYLENRIQECEKLGIDRQKISIDPGVGFGKTLKHNLQLLKGLRFFHSLGCPVLLGVSRKSFIGKADREEEATDRVGGSISALLYGLKSGVQIFRVHDVAQTRQAIAIWQAVENTEL